MKLETLKFIFATSIVLTAAGIMLPGILGYAFRLANLAIIILVALIASVAVAFAIKLVNKPKIQELEDKASDAEKSSKGTIL